MSQRGDSDRYRRHEERQYDRDDRYESRYQDRDYRRDNGRDESYRRDDNRDHRHTRNDDRHRIDYKWDHDKVERRDDINNANVEKMNELSSKPIATINPRPLTLVEQIQKEAQKAAANHHLSTAINKPVFLTKEQRAQIALKARQEQVEKQRQQQAAQREQLKEQQFHVTPRVPISSTPILTEEDMKIIRQRYIGKETEPPKESRPRDKRKFLFEWNASDDTAGSLANDETYVTPMPLFGRGFVAGIDMDLQREQGQKYEQMLAQRRGLDTQSIKKEVMRRAATDERHWTLKTLKEMTERDWRILREDFSISTKGSHIPKPIRHWREADLPDALLRVIDDVGYKEPTPIQRQAIPIGLQNRDLIGIAETGSGKTAAFLIPMLVFLGECPRLDFSNMNDGPYALILAPTRELALQIEQETKKFAQRLHYRCVALVGGHAVAQQSFNLRDGAEIVIATPGRLRDCLEQRVLVLNQCVMVILDEADKMIDMGFEADLNYILEALPKSMMKPDSDDAERGLGVTTRYRQTTMFSATMPPAVERMAKLYLRRPAVITVGLAGQAVRTVTQIVEMVQSDQQKKQLLLDLLSSGDFQPPIFVFVNQKKNADYVSTLLDRNGYKCTVLHGGKSQDQREFALSQLKSGQKEVLVATDVAGRGIDVPNVSLVVNYDMAWTIEDYTHRIGRTGRAGKTGTAVTFLSPTDTEIYFDLKQMLIQSGNQVPPELARHEAAQIKPPANPEFVSVPQKRKEFM